MVKHVLQNGQSAIIAADLWDGDSLAFTATTGALRYAPSVTFTGPEALVSVSDVGSAAAPGYASINLMPSATLLTGGLTIDHATLSINERPGGKMQFAGINQVVHGSTLTASGFGGVSSYTLNGTMNIDGTSTVNMDYVAVAGTGTFHLSGEDALLRMGTVGSGDTVKLDGGMLSLTNGMHFLGTITDSAPASSRIGPIASVAVYNALDAVRETFNQTTGVLDLFNALGADVAHLKFAGSGKLYAAPTTGLATNYISITSHETAGSLPVAFTS